MSLKSMAETLLALVWLSICAGLAAGAFFGGKWLIAQYYPVWHPFNLLIYGLLAAWAVALFALLLEAVEWMTRDPSEHDFPKSDADTLPIRCVNRTTPSFSRAAKWEREIGGNLRDVPHTW